MNTSDIRWRLMDVETTGVRPTDKIVQMACIEVDEDLNILDSFDTLIDPEIPIPAESSAVHHIVSSMVVHAPTIEEFFSILRPGKLEGSTVLVCHNVSFDRRYLAPWCENVVGEICTLRAAKRLYPDFPNYKLQTIRYHLELEAGTAHQAMGDVIALLSFLRFIKEDKGLTLTDLLQKAAEPIFVHKMPFGKHKGLPIQEVPKDYLQWLSRQDNVDPDLRYTLDKVLTK